MLIPGFDADIVVAPADVEFGEIVCAAELGDKLGDKWQRVFVLHRHHIQCMVVLY